MTNDEINAQGWIRTYRGGVFHILDPKPDEIDIVDIAHALSMTCRFTGHVRNFYSVAEHCLRVSELVPEHHRLWALLHDASEAFIADVSSPAKQLAEFKPYRTLEAKIERAIFERFGLFGGRPASVKEADVVMLSTEARDLMGVRDPVKDWSLPEPLPEHIHPLMPAVAERRYLQTFASLYRSAEAVA